MKVSGFSFVRNAVKYGYPVCESIRSVLPICDEFVLAVGNCDDGTRQLVESINDPKIRIIDTVWDDSLKSGGRVLAVETNKAFAEVSPDSDWAFYIQADELVHEKYLDTIYNAMKQYKDDKNIDGLLFKYLHFWGSYDYYGWASNWYPHEIRVVRNDKNIYSYRDAQGFRKGDNKKLWVKPIDAYIYHYGWAREPKIMQHKKHDFEQLYNDNQQKQKIPFDKNEFDYNSIDSLKKFTGTHPAVMLDRIREKNWEFDYDISKNKLKLKERFKNLLEKITGRRLLDYQNYKILK
ncbi:MAG: glycosyltransferase family 2 protein [Chitinophagaceae bacterium]|nr:glycosyltransferase family 2 protein [Chitinophagaceae bacterium]